MTATGWSYPKEPLWSGLRFGAGMSDTPSGSSEGTGAALTTRVLDRATRPPVLTAFALLQMVAVLVLSAGHLGGRLVSSPEGGVRAVGDFAAFFTGAKLVHDGAGDRLFDFQAQEEVQEGIVGRTLEDWQPYLNPPGFALLLAPTVGLGYAGSFLVFSLIQALALLAALAYLVSVSPGVGSSRSSAATAVLLVMGFLPLSLTTFGGQNTGFSVAMLAATYAAIRADRRILAGILLGLLTYKPQYAAVMGLILLLQGELRVALVAAAVGIIHYGAGALVAGFAWPLDFLAAMDTHRPMEMAANAPWHFSLPVVAGRALPGNIGKWVGILGGVGFLAYCVWSGRRIGPTSPSFSAWFGLAVTTTLLVSPHLQYYEAGILALPIFLGIDRILKVRPVLPLKIRGILAGGYFLFPTWRWSDTLGIQPFFLLLLATWAWMAFLARPVEDG